MITAHQKRKLEAYEKALLDVRKMVNDREQYLNYGDSQFVKVCNDVISKVFTEGEPTLFHTCVICRESVREDFLSTENKCNVCDPSIRS